MDDAMKKAISEYYERESNAFKEMVGQQQENLSELAEKQREELDELVQKEMDSLPSKVNDKIDKKIEDIWKEVHKVYKERIFLIFSIAVAALIVLFSFFTIKATTKANQSVIEFQNGIIERQKTVIESEENVSIVNARLLEAEGKLKAELTALDEARKSLEAVKLDLAKAQNRYQDLINIANKQR